MSLVFCSGNCIWCVCKRQWYGHVLRKEDTDWVKICMEYEVEGSRPRGRPKRTWTEVVQKDCQARNLDREDAMDRSRWKKLIKVGWWSGWWVGECFFWYRLTRVVPDKEPLNGCCCCCVFVRGSWNGHVLEVLFYKSFLTKKTGIEQVQALADILHSGYVVVATKPVHRSQIRPLVHN